MNVDDQFRTSVLDWLDRRGWSRARLATAAEISQSLISKYLTEDERKRVRPSPRNLEKLAPVLDVPYEELMQMNGYLPGDVASREQDDIEDDVHARLAEYMAAVKDTPEWAWVPIIKATFDRAIDDIRDWGRMLPSLPPDNRVPPTSADEALERGLSRRPTRRQGRINPRHATLVLAT